MAVTHSDLAPGRRSSDLDSKTGVSLMVCSILCGLLSFVLCLIAEYARSEATWVLSSIGGEKEEKYKCMYSGSGKVPLMCAAGAFLSLAMAMVMEHAYMLVAVNKSIPPISIGWNPDSQSAKALAWQAGFFFVSTWICFAVGEVLLMIGLGVESGHLKNWSRPRLTCLVVQQGLFSAAGVFGLTTVFLASGMYLIALRAQRLHQESDNVRREVLDASILYASPPRTPPHRITVTLDEIPRFMHEQLHHPPSHREPTSLLGKSMNSEEL